MILQHTPSWRPVLFALSLSHSSRPAVRTIRGEYGAAQKRLPGELFCEQLPKLAARSDRFEDLAATIYHTLGTPLDTHYEDASGRPVSIVVGGKPIRELF